MKLLNKVAFVTGAGQGMGRAIVRHFAEQGAVVVAADINLDAANQSIEGLGDKALAVCCNVADSDSVCHCHGCGPGALWQPRHSGQ